MRCDPPTETLSHFGVSGSRDLRLPVLWKQWRGHHSFGPQTEAAVAYKRGVAFGQMVDEPSSPAAEVCRMSCVTRVILEFMRVGAKVEELFGSVSGVEYVLLAAVGERVPVVVGAVADVVFEVDVFAPAFAVIAD